MLVQSLYMCNISPPQVTTHTHLLSEMELRELCVSIGMDQDLVSCYLLQEFDTEQDFSNKVGYVRMYRITCDVVGVLGCCVVLGVVCCLYAFCILVCKLQ